MTLGIRKFALDHAVNQVELVGQSRFLLFGFYFKTFLIFV